jgi:Tfp pilus assembly protein PilF
METLNETRVWTSPMRLAWLGLCAAALAGAASAGPAAPSLPGCTGDVAGCIARLPDGGVTAKDRANGLLGQAHALVRSGNTDRALGNLEEAIRLDPSLTDAYVGRGLLLHQRGDEARA